MKRILTIVFALTLVLAACGGDEGDSDGTLATQPSGDNGDTTATTDAATTTAAAVQASGNFCDAGDNNEDIIDGVDFFSADLETEVNEWLAALDQMEAAAPSEIRDDIGVMANAARNFAAILADADYQILNVDQDDPRLLAFNDGSLDEAGRNIAEYCGWDYDNPAVGDTPGDVDGGLSDDVPDSLPAALVPPEFQGIIDSGAAGVNFFTDMSYDDLLTYYTDVIGPPLSSDGFTAQWQGTVDGDTVFVNLSDTQSERLVTVLSVPG